MVETPHLWRKLGSANHAGLPSFVLHSSVVEEPTKPNPPGYEAGFEQGRLEGYEQGSKAGLEEAAAQAQISNETIVAQLSSALEQTVQARQDLLDTTRQNIVHAFAQIFDGLFCHELGQNPQLLEHIVQKVLGDEDVVGEARVSVSTYVYASLMQLGLEIDGMALVEDDKLSNGSICVTTQVLSRQIDIAKNVQMLLDQATSDTEINDE